MGDIWGVWGMRVSLTPPQACASVSMASVFGLPTLAMHQEHRRFARVPFDGPALLNQSHHSTSVRVLDLSLQGALIALPPEGTLVLGEHCTLKLPLSEAGTHITMAAEVAYLKEQQAGLHCRYIDLDSVTHLRRLLELTLGDPALLERDLAALVQTAQDDSRR